MPFIDAVPLRHLGPKSDLSVAYLNATINGTTVTVNATETTAGFSIARSTDGVYTVTFKKCRFCQIQAMWLPVAAADDRSVRLLAGIDPTAGTATLEIAASLNGAAADPSSADNELELWFLLGF
jgi:hypothetical protein